MAAEEMKAAEAARKLGVSLNHLYSLIWAGRLEARKANGHWLISADAVEARLKERGEL